jgi:hypothetical protein
VFAGATCAVGHSKDDAAVPVTRAVSDRHKVNPLAAAREKYPSLSAHDRKENDQ